MCHHPSGIEIQFTLYMISYLLLLYFKQRCVPVEREKMDEVEPVKNEQNNEMESELWKETPSPSMFYVCQYLRQK
jgi:hypothetical protein